MKPENIRCGVTTVPIILLASGEGKKPAPSELRIIPWGTFDSTKGSFYLDDVGAQSCLQLARKLSGGRQHFDYEHGAFKKAERGEFSPSAGTYTLELRSGEGGGGGLWATGIKWTEKAKEAIEAEEVLSLSPALVTDDTGRVIGVLNCALTNTPSIFNMPPILASFLAAFFGGENASPPQPTAPTPEPGETMTTPKHLILLGISAATPADQVDTLAAQAVGRLSTMQTILFSALGLGPSTTEEQARAALEALRTKAGTGDALRTQLFSLLGATSDADAIGKAGAAVAAQQKVTLLSQELASMQAVALKKEMDEMIAQGERDGKITPTLKVWAEEQAKKGADGKSVLLSFLAAASAHPVTTPPAGRTPPPPGQKPTITDAAKRVAGIFGHDPEKVAKAAENMQQA